MVRELRPFAAIVATYSVHAVQFEGRKSSFESSFLFFPFLFFFSNSSLTRLPTSRNRSTVSKIRILETTDPELVRPSKISTFEWIDTEVPPVQ